LGQNRRAGLPNVAWVLLISITTGLGYAAAQTATAPGILVDGNAVVTGFSGARPPAQIRPGVDPAALTFIDLNGPVLRVIDLHAPVGAPQAQVVFAPKPFTITAGQIGQVFAVALDNATPPNVYAAATSAYGLPIVVPDADNDGLPDRQEEGAANASFMPGLFGPAALGGGPGSIWRIDGATGAVRVFANVMLDGVANGGPALGGLAFDPVSNTLFVADRETGMVHRFDLAGTERGRYDHGTVGRRAAGLAPLPFDPARRSSIKRPPFQPANPDSWGYAPPQRRVFGLAVRDGRLYYAVAEGLQIWSVALAPDGAFGGDARMEFAVPPGAAASEISKITFDDQGGMLLAERVAPTGAFDFAELTEEGGGRVLRYAQTPSAAGLRWQPVGDEYAISFALRTSNGNGGVALGYGYDAMGGLDRNACGGFAWMTGEQLRQAQDRTLASQLAQRGPANVNGLQGSASDAARAPNARPLQSYFFDFDDRFDDPKARGHMGDVAIFRACARTAVAALPPPMPAAVPPAPPSTAALGPGIAGGPVGAGAPAVPMPPLAAPAPLPIPPGLAPVMPPGPLPGQQFGQQVGQPAGQPPAPPAGQAVGQPMAQQLVPVPGQVIGQILAQPQPGQVVGQGPQPPPPPPGGPPGAPPVTQGAAQLPPAPPPAPQPAPTVTQGSAQPAGAPQPPAGGIGIAPGAPVVQGSQLPPTGGMIVGEVEVVKKAAAGGITISKTGPTKCFPGKTCDFTITFKGAASEPSGVFEVRDIPPPGWMFMGNASGPNWNCTSPANCTYNITKHSQWPKQGLTAKSPWLKTNIAFRVPSNAEDGEVENCVNVTFPPAPGQSGKTIGVACWKVEVVNPPNLTVTKSLDKGACAPGEQCDFKITVKNTGGTPYKGFLMLIDTAVPQEFEFGGPGAISTTGSAGGLKCNLEKLGETGLFRCHKMGLGAGQQFVIAAKAKLKAKGEPVEIENCAKIWLPGSDPNDPALKGISLARAFLDYQGYPMEKGGPITEDEKKAIADYKQKNAIKDPQGNADTSGEVTDGFVKSMMPPKANASGDILESCVKLKTKEPGLLIYKEPYKYPTTKPGQPTCVFGDSDNPCGFTVKVSGRGDEPYTKPIRIDEQLPPGFNYAGFKSEGQAKWSCSGQQQHVVCTHPPANLTNKELLAVTVWAFLSYEDAKKFHNWTYDRNPEVVNCAKVLYDNPKQYDQEPKLPPAPGQVHPGRHWQACYKQTIYHMDHNFLSYHAEGTGPCYPPNCSHYDFTITSEDRRGHGPLTQRITPPSGSAMPNIRVIKAPPACPASRWSCARTGAGPAGEFTCHIDDCSLAKGDQVITRLEGSVAPDLKEPPPAPMQKTACGALEWNAPRLGGGIEQQSGKRVEVACAAIMVLARPSAPAAPVCAAGYTLLPSGLCCPTSQATATGQCCPWGQQPDAYGQTCVAVGPSAPPSAQQQVEPWQTILPGLQQVLPGRARPSYPGPSAPTSPPLSPPTAPPASPPPSATIAPTPPLQAAPVQCTGGKVPVGGQCVCPTGTTEMRGICVPAGAPPSQQQVAPLLRFERVNP
jgi:hypothetical protein